MILILWGAYISLAFVSWVIVGKHLGVGSPWVGMITIYSTTLAVTVFYIRELKTLPTPSLSALATLFVLGFANGYAVYVYSRKTESLPNAGLFILMVCVFMGAAGLVLDIILNKSVIGRYQMIGVIFALLSIFFMNLKS